MASSPSELGQPPLRVWQLTENSTRYDHMVAAPDDETLTAMWIGWASVFLFIAVYVTTIFTAILVNPQTRKSPFNWYLLFLMFPDMLFTISCTVSCWLNVSVGHYYSAAACRWQAFYIIWGCAANSWLNAVVAYEVRRMLRSSYIRIRYFPPTKRTVVKNSLLVYVYVAFVSAWPLLGLNWLPHQANVQTGLVCVPLEYSTASTFFFWLVFIPAAFGIPLFYVAYVLWDILYHNLLPPVGRRRVIGVYFFRIVSAFFIMWAPTILCFYVLNGVDPWAVWSSAVWGHLQGFVSASISLLKPDVRRAVLVFITCHGACCYCSLPVCHGTNDGDRSRVHTVFASFFENVVEANSNYSDIPIQDPATFKFTDEDDATTPVEGFDDRDPVDRTLHGGIIGMEIDSGRFDDDDDVDDDGVTETLRALGVTRTLRRITVDETLRGEVIIDDSSAIELGDISADQTLRGGVLLR